MSKLLAGAFRRTPGALPEFIRNRLPTHNVWVRLPEGGPRLRFRSAGDDVTRDIFWHGFDGYERATLAVFFGLLRMDPRCVLDIGAFTGIFGFAAAAACPNAVVHSFEPAPASFRRLEENLSLNRLPNLSVHQLAVADDSGTITMYTVPGVELGIVNSLVEGLNGAVEPVEVPAITLDEFVDVHGVAAVDLIKVDVESAEHRVFLGGSRMLERDRPIIICEVLFGQFSPSLEDMLSSRGYRFFLIRAHGLEEQRSIRPDPEWLDLNYLFVPEEKLELLPQRIRKQASEGD